MYRNLFIIVFVIVVFFIIVKYSVVSPKNPKKTVNNGIKTIKDINVEIIKYTFIDKTFFFIKVTKLFYFQPASIIIFNAVA